MIVRVRPGPVLGACARWLPRPVFGLVLAAVPGCAVLCATLWRFVSCVLVCVLVRALPVSLNSTVSTSQLPGTTPWSPPMRPALSTLSLREGKTLS